ncbi:MAG TPA: AAA family ATPase, partial [Candidatus Deferrimicrobium sp.]|nr:AAA family ATPase [Candidatus Deferrimicrobium sp.]
THDKPDVGSVCRKNVRTWLKDWYPAEVEGSDPKNIDEIEKGKPIFIKIGAPTFEAVKLALCDYKYRVGSQIPNHTRSFVKEIHFDGGTLNGTTVKFSPGLNTLIGIRGSGKSSIIEALRYTLGIEPGEKAGDPEYKKKLLKHTLGSGGKITVTAVDSFGQEFTVRRILDHIPEVFINEVLQPGVSIRETIIQKPLYFGQKDLSNSGEGFERGLVEKLIGERLTPIRLQIEIQKERVQAALRRHLQLTNISSRREEYTAKKQNAEFQLERYRSYGIDEKLQKQTAFDSDISKLKEMLLDIAKFTDAVNELFMNHEDTLRNHTFYKSKQNEPFFSVWFAEYGKILQQLDAIKQATQEIKKSAVSLGQQKAAFEKIFNDLKEEFAAVERSIMDELKSKGIPIIRTDEFRHLSKTIDQATAVLQEVAKEEAKSQEIWTELLREISTLNDLWHQEFNLVKDEMEKVNANHSSLTINTEFEGDKAKFLEFLKEMLKGSGLREMTLQKLVDENANISTIFIDKVRTNNLLGDNQGKFWEYFLSNLESYLLRRVPDKYIIKYREKELKDHSLGQRASALILFILSQKANDLIIIDQPEDDLDNQTIYNDVIQQVLTLKNDVQFIFATHNPNFPVLGDAEMVVACEYISDQINITPGSIDHPETQARIVSIMEGGEDAFKRRKEIYKIWKPRNSMT